MYFSHFDSDIVSESALKSGIKKLAGYRKRVEQVVDTQDTQSPEYSLVHAQNPDLHDQLHELKSQFKGIKHLVLIGIGGSNLGLEAVHSVLDQGTVRLHSLDTISAYEIAQLQKELQAVRSLKQLAVCAISKSGNTTETLVNASVLLDGLEEKFTKDIYQQVVFVGDSGTEFMKTGKRLGATLVPMPEMVGGRYSAATEVGLVPLALLKHDTDAFITGVLDANTENFESLTAENAARLAVYLKKGFRHYNFFAFETRLEKLGAWYRQLTAESLGKSKDRAGKLVKIGFVPTISTPVELHSVGQLYLSGYAGVYTDFVTFDDVENNFTIPKKGLGKKYGAFDVQEIATALYGGVVSAYEEKSLPYRSTVFTDESLAYSLGLFMGMRMREIMYVAELMNINAFDQPNVELYKDKTRDILGL